MMQIRDETALINEASEETLQEMNALAYALYEKQRYREAGHYFHLLTTYRPMEAKYWKGFGASLQMQQNYETALDCYACANQLNAEERDPYLYIHAADCCFALKQREEGIMHLKAAQEHATITNDQRILTHVALMRQLWESL